MNRAVDALAVCAQKMRDRRVDRARLIATEACRAAENGSAFIERVARETGFELEIVDRETEARLAAAGCVPLIDRRMDGVVLFDIGGGLVRARLARLRECRAASACRPCAAGSRCRSAS